MNTSVIQALGALNIKEWTLHGEPANETEFNENFHKVIGTDETGGQIWENDPSKWDVTWSQVQTKQSEMTAAEPLVNLRAERDRLISATDWWASADLTMTSTQTDYRQALRDITETYSSLDDVVWPDAP